MVKLRYNRINKSIKNYKKNLNRIYGKLNEIALIKVEFNEDGIGIEYTVVFSKALNNSNGGYKMQIWEYKTIKVETKGFTGGILEIEDFDYELNAMGEKGWELVSCFTTNRGEGCSREAVAVFKRKKEYL